MSERHRAAMELQDAAKLYGRGDSGWQNWQRLKAAAVAFALYAAEIEAETDEIASRICGARDASLERLREETAAANTAVTQAFAKAGDLNVTFPGQFGGYVIADARLSRSLEARLRRLEDLQAASVADKEK